jgi:hypothetical protein
VAARRLIALLAVSLLPLAGCGGSDSGTSSTAATPTSTAAAKPGSTRAIAGPFAGKLTQAGLAPFRIAVLVGQDGTGLVAYTGIDCGGRWMLGGREGMTYTFTETISQGAGGHCKSSGTVQLTQTRGGTLHYVFQGGGVTSRGFLVPASVHALLAVFREAGVPLGEAGAPQ